MDGIFHFSTLANFLGFFGVLGRPLLELSQLLNFAWWAGWCSAPGLSSKGEGKGLGCDSRRGSFVQYILLDVDIDIDIDDIDDDDDDDDEDEDEDDDDDDDDDDDGDLEEEEDDDDEDDDYEKKNEDDKGLE